MKNFGLKLAAILHLTRGNTSKKKQKKNNKMKEILMTVW
jgi:hypothetical protein